MSYLRSRTISNSLCGGETGILFKDKAGCTIFYLVRKVLLSKTDFNVLPSRYSDLTGEREKMGIASPLPTFPCSCMVKARTHPLLFSGRPKCVVCLLHLKPTHRVRSSVLDTQEADFSKPVCGMRVHAN